MDEQPTPKEATEQSPPELNWAVPESEFDLSTLKPQKHGKFTQRGDYLICGMDGHNHATKLPPGKVLTKRNGQYVLDDIVLS